MAYSDYEVVIGLEIHAQLKTKSKMFCSCSTEFGQGDNANICPVCTGQPGALPTINKKAVELSAKMGMALGCEIDTSSVFARKNYFYPDMPKGYQVSQYEKPIATSGKVFYYNEGVKKEVRIERAHMEEDAGKSSHVGSYSLVNYNRASTPLLEIVTCPDLKTPGEAADYAREVRRILRYLDVCDGNLEEGSMRCDCNISIRLKGEKKLGTKVEIKNINSFRFVEKALQFEVERQIDMVEMGQRIVQETRLYDIDKNQTFSMRTKEDAADYRYFPEPDLLPVCIDEKDLLCWKKEIPATPVATYERFREQYGLNQLEAEQLTKEKAIVDYFESVVGEGIPAKSASSWVVGELFSKLNQESIPFNEIKVSGQQLSELLGLIEKKEVSRSSAKDVFEKLWSEGGTALEWIEKLGLKQLTDASTIEKIIDEVISSFPKQVEEYQSGKEKLFGFFVGEAMKRTKGQGDPGVVNEMLLKKLKATNS